MNPDAFSSSHSPHYPNEITPHPTLDLKRSTSLPPGSGGQSRAFARKNAAASRRNEEADQLQSRRREES